MSSPSWMDRLRRLARRGSIVWVVLLLLTGAGSASRLVGARPSRAASAAASARPALALLDGIPQHGTTLGDPAAPVELVEFADLQCPACAAVNTALLPSLIEQYVRPGKVKLVFRDLHFVGPDSERLGRVAEAMGTQNRLWQFVELAFEHQGKENSGYATDAWLSELLGQIPGADVRAALADRDSSSANEALQRASHEADELNVQATPSFFVVRGGQPPREIEIASLSPSRFARELTGTAATG